MGQKSQARDTGATKAIKDIRGVTRKHYSADEKIHIVLDNYYFPVDLKVQIEAFVEHYNHQRYQESINNLTPADVYFEHGQSIIKLRERATRKTLETRRLQYRKHAAQYYQPDKSDPLLDQAATCSSLYDNGQEIPSFHFIPLPVLFYLPCNLSIRYSNSVIFLLSPITLICIPLHILDFS